MWLYSIKITVQCRGNILIEEEEEEEEEGLFFTKINSVCKGFISVFVSEHVSSCHYETSFYTNVKPNTETA